MSGYHARREGAARCARGGRAPYSNCIVPAKPGCDRKWRAGRKQSETLFLRCFVVHHSAFHFCSESSSASSKLIEQQRNKGTKPELLRVPSPNAPPLPELEAASTPAFASETLFHRCFVVHHSAFQKEVHKLNNKETKELSQSDVTRCTEE
jgi:hypothetical protein